MKTNISKISQEIRKSILTMSYKSKSSHVGTSLSCVDILATLYFKSMNIDTKFPKDPLRDRFILSKGHGAMALYATLSHRGFFPISKLNEFYSDGGSMAGHPSINCVPGVEASTGSLGHGLSIACGMAYAGKMEGSKHKIFVLLSDGECDEGSVWEAAMFAGFKKLSNIVAIIDYNKIQSFGNVKEVLDLEPLSRKWEAFGWSVKEIDGHDHKQIEDTMMKIPFEKDKPNIIIAHTIKGKGVSYMENMLEWHYKSPNDDEYKRAMEGIK